MRTFLSLLLLIFSFLPLLQAQYNKTGQVSRYLEKIREEEASLQLFFEQMPKGADLHYHYSGSLYPEDYLRFARQAQFFVQPDSLLLAPAAPTANWISFQEWEQSPDFETQYRAILRKWSVQDFFQLAVTTPPDRHFFSSFLGFTPVETHPGVLRRGLAHLQGKAMRENIQYLEVIHRNVFLGKDFEWEERAYWENWFAQYDTCSTEALRAGFERLSKSIDLQEEVRAYCDTLKAAHPADTTTILRYQAFALRIWEPLAVFLEMQAAFEAAVASRLIVGVNVVGAENSPNALKDYQLHMRMLAFFRQKYPAVRLALHAGELTPNLATPEDLSYHIREALRTAKADRIGHGIAIAHEKNAPEVLQEMARRNIPVEVNLSSNRFILGVSGKAHPLWLYRRFRVPVVIGTDDEGVLRTNLAAEYAQLVRDFDLDYTTIKKLVFNSLNYSFLPEAQKEKQLRELERRFLVFEEKVRGW